MNKKEIWLSEVAFTIKNNPEWYSDTIFAMQFGLESKISEVEDKNTALAYALVGFVQEDKKNKFPYYHNIQDGLKVLANFFAGAGVETTIRSHIEENEDDL